MANRDPEPESRRVQVGPEYTAATGKTADDLLAELDGKVINPTQAAVAQATEERKKEESEVLKALHDEVKKVEDDIAKVEATVAAPKVGG